MGCGLGPLAPAAARFLQRAHINPQLASCMLNEDISKMSCSSLSTLVLCLIFSSYVLPQEQVLSEAGFDVGPVGSCKAPETAYCIEITYDVPAPIARLTEVIEFEIRNTVEPPDSVDDAGPCREILKETLCRKKFPRCSTQDNQVYYENPENCEERLSNNCNQRQAGSLIKLGYCESTQANLHSGSCRTLSSYDQDNELQHCNLLDSDIQISDWMYSHIYQVNQQLQQSSLSPYFVIRPTAGSCIPTSCAVHWGSVLVIEFSSLIPRRCVKLL